MISYKTLALIGITSCVYFSTQAIKFDKEFESARASLEMAGKKAGKVGQQIGEKVKEASGGVNRKVIEIQKKAAQPESRLHGLYKYCEKYPLQAMAAPVVFACSAVFMAMTDPVRHIPPTISCAVRVAAPFFLAYGILAMNGIKETNAALFSALTNKPPKDTPRDAPPTTPAVTLSVNIVTDNKQA